MFFTFPNSETDYCYLKFTGEKRVFIVQMIQFSKNSAYNIKSLHHIHRPLEEQSWKNRPLNAFVINESLQTFQKPPASWLLGWGTRSGHFLWRLSSVWRVHTSPVSPPCFEPLRSGRHLSVSLKTSVLFQCLCLGRCVWTWKHTCMQTQKIKVRARF